MKTAIALLFVSLSLCLAVKSRFSTSSSGEVCVFDYAKPFQGVESTSSSRPYISLGNALGAVGTDDFTITFRFRTSATDRLFDIAGNRQQGSHGNFIALRLANSRNGLLTFEIDQTSSGTNYIATTSKQEGLNDGQWHRVIITRKGTEINLIVDGVSNGAKTGGLTNVTGQYPFRLGKSYSGFANVAIDFQDVRFYPRHITAAELDTLF
mmetsp:Transcript_3756/g.3188  ORF Transcript_3756/g.3188 Transcript_3756/m.3188 type:complete len:209 (-) Transcript_3756:108-734(-)|eukprot:CAMPEP_0114598208 /NCGR_PEP_ID=MMETSP0125-20121206/20535_1 /TAXON_ID=485358 ORGANISM="Aristerostoma sp., Strain ATCC 50986" /NCGR_SAMPLE_ID=MMETSP0125 /ASSEMBLY_ACC=CAM_ASM_000245 /LENGTH=208 /DNA_ID=CAMNT_0001803623 /DNA_START=34 /DNA_END=660 /DNA_ORIENTATION=-